MAIPAYLQPYLDAAARHGAGFESLLWASPKTQAARFDAIARLCLLDGQIVLDAGCGRADFLDYVLRCNIQPAKYIGLEAVEELVEASRGKKHARAKIISGDFVRDPHLLEQNADAVIFSGSLNTLGSGEFFQALRDGWDACQCQLAFNFLCSPKLAAADHLIWHRMDDVMGFAESLDGQIALDDQYLDGDCTIVVSKS